MKINEKIMNLRKKAGISQEELAEKLNVTRQTVSKWELGTINPKMDKISEMSKIFNVTLEELINEEEIVMEEKEKVSANSYTPKDNNVRKWPIILTGVLLIVLLIVLIFRIIVMGSVLDIGNNIFSFIMSSMKSTNDDYHKQYEEKQKSLLEFYNNVSAQMNQEYEEEKKKSEKKHEEFEKNFNEQAKKVEEEKKKALEIEESVKKMMK